MKRVSLRMIAHPDYGVLFFCDFSLGGISGTALVDTGCSRSVFDKSTFKVAGNKSRKLLDILKFSKETTLGELFKFDYFTVGSYEIPYGTVILDDLSWIGEKLGLPTDIIVIGVLGSDFFLDFCESLNFSESYLELKNL